MGQEAILDREQILCKRHGEIFKFRWPVGFVEFAEEALQQVMRQPEIWDKTGEDMEKLIPILQEKPVCCRLAPVTLFNIYEMINLDGRIWAKKKCSNCLKDGYGAPYRVRRPNERIVFLPHVCIYCVVFSLF